MTKVCGKLHLWKWEIRKNEKHGEIGKWIEEWRKKESGGTEWDDQVCGQTENTMAEKEKMQKTRKTKRRKGMEMIKDSEERGGGNKEIKYGRN